MIDVARVGGITPWMKVAAMAEAFNLPVVSHILPEIQAHVVAACPNGLTVEYMPWMLCLFEETPRLEKGALVLSDKPGLDLRCRGPGRSKQAHRLDLPRPLALLHKTLTC